MNIVEEPSFVGSNRERWKCAYVEHLRNQRFNFALTVAWNKSTPLPLAREDLKVLDRLVNQELLGPKFHKKRPDQRTLAVFVFEGIGPGGHIHAHSLWRIKRRQDILPFARLFPGERGGIWNDIVVPGSYKLAINNDPDDFAGYCLKGQHMNSNADEVIWSLDFLRPR